MSLNLSTNSYISIKKISPEKDFVILKQDGLNTQLLITDRDAEEYIDIAIKISMKKYYAYRTCNYKSTPTK